jgi:hypothetical protein
MKRFAVGPWVLVGLLSACGGAPGLGGVPADTPRSVLPAAMVGSWYEGSISTIDYYDPVTGVWAPPSGSGFAYTFHGDGTYEYTGILQVSTYGCTSTLLGYYTGTVTVSGDVLTTYQNGGRTKYETNCGTNSETAAEPEVTSYSWQIAPDEYGEETLTLTWPDGETSAFRRWED